MMKMNMQKEGGKLFNMKKYHIIEVIVNITGLLLQLVLLSKK